MITSSLCICLLILLSVLNNKSVYSIDRPDLYTSSDDVVRLSASTFQSIIFEKNPEITSVVQFYNTFCGHCQGFAPVYKELASRVRNWTSIVQIAGIDCSKPENMNTCSDNNIQGYPTILIFPPNSKFRNPEDAPLNLRSIPIEWTVDDIEDSIVDYITNLTRTNRHYPPSVNALLPIEVHDPTKIGRIFPQNHHSQLSINEPNKARDLLFVVESEKSYIGRKLILEYSRINSNLELRRILLNNTQLLEALLTKVDYAALKDNQPILIKMVDTSLGSEAQILVKGETDHVLPTLDDSEREDFIFNRFKMFFEHFYTEELKAVSGDYEARNKPEKNSSISQNAEIDYLIHKEPSVKGKVFAVDLLKGMSYMLSHEILMRGNLRPEEFTTVRNLLSVLDKYLPIDQWDLTFSRLISNLRTRLDENRARFEKHGIEKQQLRDFFNVAGIEAIASRYNRENWISCYDSDRQYKGYTCSLWLLFHTLTVSEYKEKEYRSKLKPLAVLYSMRDYITQFLGCTVCSSNFAVETKSLESSLVRKNSSVLWLWNTHNQVSQRLNNERIEGKKHLIDVIFPSPRSCPQCFISDPDHIGEDGKTLADIEWDSKEVFKFMEILYDPARLITPARTASLLKDVRAKIKYDLLSNDPEEKYLQSIFTASDLSICLLLYLSCVVIVVIVCIALNPRWKPTRFRTDSFLLRRTDLK